MKAIASGTLLTYAMATSLDPVEVSLSPETPSVTNLTFVASCPMDVGSCTVRQIEIALPVGDPAEPDPTDLTEVAPPRSAASISSSDGAVWNVAPGVAAGSFIFTPESGPVLIESQALTLTIAGVQVAPLVGTAQIPISEWAAAGSEAPPIPPAAASGQATFAVAKFPAGFFAFDFAPSAPEVISGSSVTLTWQGSTNATFDIGYDEVDPVDVTNVRTWTSPPIYVATTFLLYASASQAGQTVTLEQSTTVTVSAPQVVSFYATPNQIDIDETVTLSWRAVDADGVYLLTGQTAKQTLPPVSDPDNPQTLQPQYGEGYALQAFKGAGEAQVTSSPIPLSYTFNPLDFVSLTASSMTIDVQNPSTTVSWDVRNAVTAFLNGAEVGLNDSTVESPTAGPALYALTATWVDGSTQVGPSIQIDVESVVVENVLVYFNDLGDQAQFSIVITAENATGGALTDVAFMAGVPAIEGRKDAPALAADPNSGTPIGNNQWLFQYLFTPPFGFPPDQSTIQFGYIFYGLAPVSAPPGQFYGAPGAGTYPPST